MEDQLMFNIPMKLANSFNIHNHHLYISTMNIYYHTLRLLNGHHKILDQKTYKEYFKNIVGSVHLTTPPMDAFVPTEDEKDPSIFSINREMPEYKEIGSIITRDQLKNILPATHEVIVKLGEDNTLYDTILDDIVLYYSVFKYLDQISAIRLKVVSSMTDLIEHVICNITVNDIKRYLVSNKISEEKFAALKDGLFMPDVEGTQSFYAAGHEDIGIPAFDAVNLLKRLITNKIVKSDTYIVLAIYAIMSFAVADITDGKAETSECANYVKDVLSKI